VVLVAHGKNLAELRKRRNPRQASRDDEPDENSGKAEAVAWR
jgi:hypothetical protein